MFRISCSSSLHNGCDEPEILRYENLRSVPQALTSDSMTAPQGLNNGPRALTRPSHTMPSRPKSSSRSMQQKPPRVSSAGSPIRVGRLPFGSGWRKRKRPATETHGSSRGQSDLAAILSLAHCDAVGRGYPPHQFSVTINKAAPIQ